MKYFKGCLIDRCARKALNDVGKHYPGFEITEQVFYKIINKSHPVNALELLCAFRLHFHYETDLIIESSKKIDKFGFVEILKRSRDTIDQFLLKRIEVLKSKITH